MFPWNNNIKPYWTNPDNGLVWYVDTNTSSWCKRYFKGYPELKATVLLVCEKKNEEIKPLSRILINAEGEILADEQSLDAMCLLIDILRFNQT